ncbi:hypothetical protein EJ05DRAFT_266427 [Pseudovirgaria hyperparasitica]|uniref:Uncharacterized protein n=1 Tax=Pseudovirgaria hyperparasitica TaxID=470096 RepID=A0A6A6VSK9_9PEZI|nr:uncharacterized protein EJ05DRAFT_266427 [Pseudovirgaria hyperparasitica]KAF2752766.1 hypothetical protein EJ05DRAFT_266427 [Pseudovirgaria hyperparasitica]
MHFWNILIVVGLVISSVQSKGGHGGGGGGGRGGGRGSGGGGGGGGKGGTRYSSSGGVEGGRNGRTFFYDSIPLLPVRGRYFNTTHRQDGRPLPDWAANRELRGLIRKKKKKHKKKKKPEEEEEEEEDGFVTCVPDAASLNGTETDAAMDKFLKDCDGEKEFKKKKETSADESTFFGCDYGHGQKCHRDDILDMQAWVYYFCGDLPGWYSRESWKVTYGRAPRGVENC